MGSSSTRQIKAVETTFEIIETLRTLDGGTVTELANQLEYSKSTIQYHLRTLTELGLLVETNTGYYLSAQFLYFGLQVRNRNPIFDIVRPKIDRLALETKESAKYMILEQGRGIYIYHSRGELAVPSDTEVGKPRYLHLCSPGKAMLAELSPDEADRVIDRWGLPSWTKHTITDREQLFNELSRIREQGYAVNREEAIEGLYAIGAAVSSSDGQVLGGISISGPPHRLATDGNIDQNIVNLVRGTVEDIELNIDYS
jgi:DNA-binding IclR family transcriptional regulator